MVRLVFRPYTQVRRTICTSVSLRASTRVSSGFASLRHSSPSFGSRQACSNSNPSQKIGVGRRCAPPPPEGGGFPPVSFLAPSGFHAPVDSHACQTPWSVFQDGSDGEPAGRCLERVRAPRGTSRRRAPDPRPHRRSLRGRDRPPGLRPPARPATVRTPSRAADRLAAVPHPTEAHRRPPSASLPAISSTL